MKTADSIGIATAGIHNQCSGTLNSLSVSTEGWHSDGDASLFPRHYPRLRQLGSYDSFYPPGSNAFGNKQIDLLVVSRALDKLDDFASSIRKEMNPLTAMLTLPSWESFVGIKGASTENIIRRREFICAKLRSRGGLSKKYFRSIVAALGYTYGEGTTHPIWFVEGSGQYFRAGISHAGDMIFSIGVSGIGRTVTICGAGVEDDQRLAVMFEDLRCIGVEVLFKNS